MPVAYDDRLWRRFVETVCTGVSFIEACRRVGLSYSGARARWATLGGMSMQLGRQGGLMIPMSFDPRTRVAKPDLPPGRSRVLSMGERAVIEVRFV